MNNQEASVQIESLEADLREAQQRCEALEQELEQLSSRHAEAQAENLAFKADIWSIDEVQMALEAVSRSGSEFVIHMDHRLRTSLNGLLGMVELLANCDLSPDQLEYAEGASSSGRELLCMFNDILDYCRLDAGHIDVQKESLECDALFADLCAPYQGEFEVACSRGEGVPESLLVDGVHLPRALGHLLDNATRHASNGGVALDVKVIGGGEQAELAFTVTDEGPGIPQEDLARVCEAFEKAGDDEHDGIGLGLTIVRRLAELMGGRFELSSAVDKGTTAVLSFPFAELAPEVPTEEQPAEPLEASRVAEILVVEDNEVNQKVALGFLKMIGCQTKTAVNGREAIEQLAAHEFDLVLMDCMMPEVDGYEATQRIRDGESGEKQATIPIIALTADDSAGARQNCLHAGMDDYMTKPVRIDRLRAMLRIWLPPALRPSAS